MVGCFSLCWAVTGLVLPLLLPLCSAGIWDRIQRNDITPPLKTPQGELTGLFQESAGGKKFMGFYGIPYGQAPVGDLRFTAPKPAAGWEGVRAAQSEGDMCYQPQPTRSMKPQGSVKSASDVLKVVASLPGAARLASRYLLHMSEDCLNLNVYTPEDKLPADQLHPVLVWIHGGEFMSGSGDYMMFGPEYLMDLQVVIVSMNYRLGPFGFLSSNSSDAPGNAGLKDQRLALQWVQQNIRHFGGDPDRVTIYGESTGAVSVHLHVLSPHSKGLFHAAIMSSGVAQELWVQQGDPDTSSKKLAEALGAGADTVADVKRRVQFLRDAPVKDIMASIKDIQAAKKERVLDDVLMWLPVVEGPDGDDQPFLDRHPNDILLSGEYNVDLPLMIGLNSKEGSIMIYKFKEDDVTKLQANPSFLLASSLFDKVDANSREALSERIRDLYFKDQSISKETFPNIADALGDEFIAHGIRVATHWHLKHNKAPVFLYYFTLDAFGIASFLLGTKDLPGAGHGDDLGYVFKNHMVSDMGTVDKERVANGTAMMTNLVANFLTARNPTPSKTETLLVEWAPATLEKPVYVEIGDNLTLRAGVPLEERLKFWDEATKIIVPDPIYDLN